MLLIVACCAPRLRQPSYATVQGPIRVCLDLPAPQLKDAELALSEWDAAIHNWRPIIRSESACDIRVKTTTRVLPEVPNALAWCGCVGCGDIYMRIGTYESDVRGILEHEIGHALGAQHADDTLMDPIWQQGVYTCPDRETVMQVAAWNHIDSKLLSWCEFMPPRSLNDGSSDERHR